MLGSLEVQRKPMGQSSIRFPAGTVRLRRSAVAATVARACAVACVGAVTSTALAQQFVEQQATRFPQPPLNEYTNQISVCDVDGDIDLDIAFANGGGFPSAGPDQQVRLFINNGLGFFTDESIARIGALLGDFRGVEFGDIDRDGDLDMVLANDNNALPRLLTNNGLGVFTNVTATNLPNLTLASSRAQFGDVDNDGDLDLYFTNGTTSRFGTGRGKLYLSNGTGVFTDVTTTNTPNENVAEPQDCIFGDIDGDFDLDLRIGSTFSNQSKLYFNNGAGVFSTPPVAPPPDNNCYSYDFGDLNGDGDLDLIGANGSGSSINAEIQLNNDGAGVFTLGAFTGSTVDDNDSKFLDYDNDGDLDLFICRIGGPERAYSNNGTGTFSLVVPDLMTAVADSSLDIKVADFNGDGKYDLVTGQGESGSFLNRIYMNGGPADTRPPNIVRTEQLPNTALPGPFVVRTVIFDAHTSDRGFHDKGVTLNWRNVPALDGGKEGSFAQVPMAWSGNSLWRGVIPAQATSGTVEYFVTALDFASNLATGPTRSFILSLPDCPADINNSGAVDVDDLIAVILSWGCTNPPGPCEADIDDSGVVEVDDLFAVILAWGPCT